MFAHLKATLLKVDLREGKKVLVFETESRLSGGELEALSEMIKKEVILGVDSQVISYRIRKNARTDKPLVSYKVDQSGVVEEVKEQGEQLELDLGMGAEKVPVKEEVLQIDLDVVQEFISAGLAPRFLDIEFDLPDIIRRHAEGENYARLAAEIDLSSGKLAELLESYYGRLAPLAAKWDEWRQSKAEQPASAEASGDETADEQAGTENDAAETSNESVESDDDLPQAAEGEQRVDQGEYGKNSDTEDTLSDWEREVLEGEDPQSVAQEDLQPADIEAIILTEKPRFEDIPYDFPALLARKKAGETWIEIANSIGTRSTVLSNAWSQYKKRVADQRGGAA